MDVPYPQRSPCPLENDCRRLEHRALASAKRSTGDTFGRVMPSELAHSGVPALEARPRVEGSKVLRLVPPNGTRISSPLRVEETEAVATGAFTGALIVETACPSRFPPVFKTSEVWQPQAG